MTERGDAALDFSALERPARFADLRLLLARESAGRRFRIAGRGAVAALGAAVTVGILVFLLFFAPAEAGVRVPVIGDHPAAPWVVLAVLVCWFAAVAVWVGGSIARSARLSSWAFDNGLGYARSIADRRWSGTPFRPGRSRTHDVIGAERNGLDFVLGRYRWMGTKDRGGALQAFTFLQLDLPSEVPHIVLRNARAGVFAGQGLGLRGSQRLSLEGDFDRTFRLHCPPGYERDALYIFTPDLMALLLDLTPNCELELQDGHATLYLGRDPQLWRARQMRALLHIVEVLSRKLDRQTGCYADDRRGARAGGVAIAGQRLRTGISGPAVLTALLFSLPTVVAAIVLLATLR